MNTIALLNTLLDKKDSTTEETCHFVNAVVEGSVPATQIASILTAFRMKGETPDEILGFIQAMRQHMIKVSVKNAIDVCGTGGDGSGTFNISTAVAFVVAGCGVKVVKHGNRAASSNCGSADVLEALGVAIQLSPQQAEQVIEKTGMVFLFAPFYHPAFKQVAVIRKELGVRTIFNALGPFANPASVKRQLIGVPNYEIAQKLAIVAQKLFYDHVIIVTSEDGMDEVSLFAKTHVFGIKNGLVREFLIDPKKLGFTKTQRQAIKGGTAKENALMIRQIFSGELKGEKRDIVILNSACALIAASMVHTIEEGIAMATESIESGKAMSVLQSLIKETRKYA